MGKHGRAMIEWLRRKAQEYNGFGAIDVFIDWLERTGASPWVSVEERLPEKLGWVWVNRYYRGYPTGKRKRENCTAKYLKTHKMWVAPGGATVRGVTHWMPPLPLPVPRKESR